MQTWERARVGSHCGGCGRDVEVGDPILVFVIARGNRPARRFLRCAACDGPAPPDLPALVERINAITPRPMTRFPPVLPLGSPLADYRARQSGEREPGEEG